MIRGKAEERDRRERGKGLGRETCSAVGMQISDMPAYFSSSNCEETCTQSHMSSNEINGSIMRMRRISRAGRAANSTCH